MSKDQDNNTPIDEEITPLSEKSISESSETSASTSELEKITEQDDASTETAAEDSTIQKMDTSEDEKKLCKRKIVESPENGGSPAKIPARMSTERRVSASNGRTQRTSTEVASPPLKPLITKATSPPLKKLKPEASSADNGSSSNPALPESTPCGAIRNVSVQSPMKKMRIEAKDSQGGSEKVEDKTSEISDEPLNLTSPRKSESISNPQPSTSAGSATLQGSNRGTLSELQRNNPQLRKLLNAYDSKACPLLRRLLDEPDRVDLPPIDLPPIGRHRDSPRRLRQEQQATAQQLGHEFHLERLRRAKHILDLIRQRQDSAQQQRIRQRQDNPQLRELLSRPTPSFVNPRPNNAMIKRGCRVESRRAMRHYRSLSWSSEPVQPRPENPNLGPRKHRTRSDNLRDQPISEQKTVNGQVLLEDCIRHLLQQGANDQSTSGGAEGSSGSAAEHKPSETREGAAKTCSDAGTVSESYSSETDTEDTSQSEEREEI